MRRGLYFVFCCLSGLLTKELSGQVDLEPLSKVILADRKVARSLERIDELLQEKGYREAVKLLQQIIEMPEDGFIASQNSTNYQGAKTRAIEILGSLPPEGLEAYQIEFGADASQLLENAKNLESISEVFRRYFFTEAGEQASRRLGAMLADRGQPVGAALVLERALTHPGSEVSPGLIAQTILCFEQAGLPEDAKRVLNTYHTRITGERFRLGGQETYTRDLASTIQLLKKGLPGRSFGDENENVFFQGKTPSRTGTSKVGSPYLKSFWGLTSVKWSDINPQTLNSETIDLTSSMEAAEQLPKPGIAFASFSPLVAGETVLARTFHHIHALDLKTGKELWRSAESDPALEFTRRQEGLPNRRFPGLANLLQQRGWEDQTFGTLSTNGEMVFAIADLGVLGGASGSSHPIAIKEYNRLMAYDVRSGKFRWEVGGAHGDYDLDLAGTFFLGPPLPLGDHLYCLGESSGEVRLIVLEAKTGKPSWTQSLAPAGLGVSIDLFRRKAGLTPSAKDGILICPTGAGIVIAVDLTTKSLKWAHRYLQTGSDVPDQRVRMMIAMQQRQGMQLTRQHWQHSWGMISSSHVLLTPQESEQLICLNLINGEVLWSIPRENALYAEIVPGERVFLISEREVECLSLRDGKGLWKSELMIPPPSGRGYFTQQQYYLPLATGEVWGIQLGTCEVLSRSRSRDGQIPGNLTASRGYVLSHTPRGLTCYRDLSELETEVIARLEQDPNDWQALGLRGEMRLDRGELELARSDLRKSLQLHPSSETKQILFDSLIEGLRTNFKANLKSISETEQLIDRPEQLGLMLTVLAKGYEETEELSKAYESYLALATKDVGKQPNERASGDSFVRRDRFAQARMASIYERSNPELRKQFDQDLDKRAEEALKGTPEVLRRFLELFPYHSSVNQVRRALYLGSIKEGYNAKTEAMLSELRRNGDPETRDWATQEMADQLFQIGREKDVLSLLDQLPESQSTKLKNDPRIQAILRRFVWPDGEVEVSTIPALARSNARFPFQWDSSQKPFFEGVQIMIDQSKQAINAYDSQGTALFSITNGPLQNFFIPYMNTVRARDHLLLVTQAHQVTAIDLLGENGKRVPKILWRENLVHDLTDDINRVPLNFRQIPLPGGGLKMLATDGNGDLIGEVVPAGEGSIAMLQGRTLHLLDSQTGERFWQVSGIIPGSRLLVYEDSIVACPPGEKEAARFRMTDGIRLEPVQVPIPEAWIFSEESRICAWLVSPKPADQLLLWDVKKQTAIFEREFPSGTQFTTTSDGNMLILSPEGSVSLLQRSDFTELWNSKVPELENSSRVLTWPAGNTILVMGGEIQMNQLNQRYPVGTNNVVIKGLLVALDRETGKSLWKRELDYVGLDLTQPRDLPAITFVTRKMTVALGNRGQGAPKWDSNILIIDKRNGDVLLDRWVNGTASSLEIVGDPTNHTARVSVPISNPSAPLGFLLTFTDKQRTDNTEKKE